MSDNVPDMVIDYEKHVADGNVWKVMVQLPMQDAPDDVPDALDVEVHVVAPDIHLARYIASTLVKDGIVVEVDDSELVTNSGA